MKYLLLKEFKHYYTVIIILQPHSFDVNVAKGRAKPSGRAGMHMKGCNDKHSEYSYFGKHVSLSQLRWNTIDWFVYGVSQLEDK